VMCISDSTGTAAAAADDDDDDELGLELRF
jgi:hypothetical protein